MSATKLILCFHFVIAKEEKSEDRVFACMESLGVSGSANVAAQQLLAFSSRKIHSYRIFFAWILAAVSSYSTICPVQVVLVLVS